MFIKRILTSIVLTSVTLLSHAALIAAPTMPLNIVNGKAAIIPHDIHGSCEDDRSSVCVYNTEGTLFLIKDTFDFRKEQWDIVQAGISRKNPVCLYGIVKTNRKDIMTGGDIYTAKGAGLCESKTASAPQRSFNEADGGTVIHVSTTELCMKNSTVCMKTNIGWVFLPVNASTEADRQLADKAAKTGVSVCMHEVGKNADGWTTNGITELCNVAKQVATAQTPAPVLESRSSDKVGVFSAALCGEDHMICMQTTVGTIFFDITDPKGKDVQLAEWAAQSKNPVCLFDMKRGKNGWSAERMTVANANLNAECK
jgi:hypothetical protein